MTAKKKGQSFEWSFTASESRSYEGLDDDASSTSGWSEAVNQSRFFNEGVVQESCLAPLVRWCRGLTRTQKLLYLLGALAAGIIVAASIFVFRQWGLSSSSSANDLSNPNSPPLNDPSDEPPLWETSRPSSKPPPLQSPPPGPPPVPPQSPPGPPPSPPLQEATDPPTTKQPSTGAPTKKPSSSPTKQPSPAPTPSLTKQPSPAPQNDPTASPIKFHPPTYFPGNLTTLKLGLLLSEGLDARVIAWPASKVVYDLGGESKLKFHDQPDAGATFPDEREGNEGGWIYVSNSEVPNRKGGVGAFTFDKDANVLDYQIVLEKTNMNCGGGRTPWNTWVSCEEVEFTGLIYQVDPTGDRDAEVMTLGSDGGRWESFSYDVRDRNKPRFFATEDHNKGTVRRFTPEAPQWDQPWDMLHGAGVTDFLMISPNATNDGGTFIWTNDIEAAKNNARSYYPQTEGIDAYGPQLFFVCKRIQQLFILDLDEGTYSNRTTVNGLLDGKPDSIARVLGDTRDLLYFTEEGGVDSGIHARDHLGRFYTVFESPEYPDETTGLSFSPDGKFMYAAYQNTGILYTVFRTDGLPFHAAHLDVKYHRSGGG